MEATSLRFAAAARLLAGEARRLGLDAPGFRSPPRLPGVDRSMRRGPGGVTVSIAVRDRPWAAVLADMIEGVLAVNDVPAADAGGVRAALWEAVAPADPPAPPALRAVSAA